MLQYCSKYWLEGNKKFFDRKPPTEAQSFLIEKVFQVLTENTDLSEKDARGVAEMWVRATNFKKMPKIKFAKYHGLI